MTSRHTFTVIDSHTGGNPTRLVISGIPELLGNSVMAKMLYFRANHDWIRTALVLEPRGGNLTSCAVLVPPSHADADIGIFFMEPMGYLPMCGSDTIGLVTMLIESGSIPSTDPRTAVRIDTPAGLIEAVARTDGGLVEDVTFVNVPAFVAGLDIPLDVGRFGQVLVDVAYGGNFYVIVDARQFGLELTAEYTAPAIEVARQVLAAARESVDVVHPEDSSIRGITHVQFYTSPHGDDADARIMVVIEPGIVDRSPCGTGTTAKVATLMQRGLLGLGDSFTHESVTGQTFTGRPVALTLVGDEAGYSVAITGRAFITAEATMIVDSRDPLGHGFLVN